MLFLSLVLSLFLLNIFSALIQYFFNIKFVASWTKIWIKSRLVTWVNIICIYIILEIEIWMKKSCVSPLYSLLFSLLFAIWLLVLIFLKLYNYEICIFPLSFYAWIVTFVFIHYWCNRCLSAFSNIDSLILLK